MCDESRKHGFEWECQRATSGSTPDHSKRALALPSSAIGKIELPVVSENVIPFPVRSFVDPDPFEELTFKNAIEAKRAIAHYLVKPKVEFSAVNILWIHFRNAHLVYHHT
ncbi:MAG: hypothetical protein RLZZ74_1145 [Cyanobacteriota bacterium]